MFSFSTPNQEIGFGNVSEMTCFVLSGQKTLTDSVNAKCYMARAGKPVRVKYFGLLCDNLTDQPTRVVQWSYHLGAMCSRA